MSPKRTPAYYICPRCSSKDIYFATRSAGSIGNIIDLPSGMANPTVGYQMEKKVAFCRPCGERADYVPEVVVYSDREKEEKERNEWFITGIFFILLGGCSLIYFTGEQGVTFGYFLFPFFALTLGLLLTVFNRKRNK